jgi:hypothetical protein
VGIAAVRAALVRTPQSYGHVKTISASLTTDENRSAWAARVLQTYSIVKSAYLTDLRFHVVKQENKEQVMCRNIKTLFNFDPPATDEEIREASLQFVRKLSGFNKPSKANEAAFSQAVEEVSTIARHLLDTLVTSAEPYDREVEAERARIRTAKRFQNNEQVRN